MSYIHCQVVMVETDVGGDVLRSEVRHSRYLSSMSAEEAWAKLEGEVEKLQDSWKLAAVILDVPHAHPQAIEMHELEHYAAPVLVEPEHMP